MSFLLSVVIFNIAIELDSSRKQYFIQRYEQHTRSRMFLFGFGKGKFVTFSDMTERSVYREIRSEEDIAHAGPLEGKQSVSQ
jgi:hypothetical protein